MLDRCRGWLAEFAPDAAGLARRCTTWVCKLGPGLITGAADDDPSGISTYSIAGASAGFSMLWVALITTPMMAVIQGMCARIGMVTGEGLAAVIRKAFPAWFAYTLAALVIGANTLNIGADIAGMAASMKMLTGGPQTLWVLVFGVALVAVQLYLDYAVFVRAIKYLTLSLLAYVITALVVHPNWLDIARHTLVPEFRPSAGWFTTLTGVLGTTITPYLFFWQSALMVEEERALGRATRAERRGASAADIAWAHNDVNTGMIYSNAVMFFIIVTTAATLGNHGKAEIHTAQDAADALRPLAGQFAYLLFTAGMVGTGLLAIPVLASSSAYVAAETFGFREGLSEKPDHAPRFYSVIAAGVFIGIAINLLRIDPIAALFLSAVVNGLAAVPLVIVITLIANRRGIMGNWRSSRLATAWATLTAAVMSVAAVSMFVFWGQ